jgi:proline iminopeptidase
MSPTYPEIKPFLTNLLDVGDGNRIYWEECGNPNGKPVVVLHGGPGSGNTPRSRRFFDPAAYRIILFDQRGCGRSWPHASDLETDLSVNTTWHLIADMECLRAKLGVERWMLFGGSWGSTLGLVYAEMYPERVSEIVLWGVAMTRPPEIDWLYRRVEPLFPEEYARFVSAVPAAERTDNIIDDYFRLLHNPDPAVRQQAARDFHDWEWALFTIIGEEPPTARWLNQDFQLARARICTHYFRNNAWLEDDFILKHIDALSEIPGVMVHGRLDVGSPLAAAWELAQV